MQVHLVDGTYELFRCYYGAPAAKNKAGREVGATRALLRSLASWLRQGTVTHAGCAFDHVIESFRNDLFAGYKTGDGMDPDLYAQFELAERAVAALGLVVWPMVEFEADDALATAAVRFASDEVQAVICSPDKDMAQCVKDGRIVAFDRQRQTVYDEAGVRAKFGVPPSSIPDLLALVGDTADGIPGIARWGMKSAATVLAEYGTLERIPAQAKAWSITVRGAEALATSLREGLREAKLYKQLATLRFDVPLRETLGDLAWRGMNREALEPICRELDDLTLLERLASGSGGGPGEGADGKST